MKVKFAENAMIEYMEWQFEDSKTLRSINALIKSIQRNGFMKGLGKPEVLKGRKEFSRRIDEKNRLVYKADAENDLLILSCKGHYDE